MFNGIVEAVGRVVAAESRGGGTTLEVETPFAAQLAAGQSVAVDGVCLTVRQANAVSFKADVARSTAGRTIAAGYAPGAAVNLERGLRVGERIDGHFVQGHVDGVGTLIAVIRSGNTKFMDFELPADVSETTILYGSIALNGVSLTVNAMSGTSICQVAVVPHTWESTNLSRLEPGGPVNVEADLIGKYVQRLLEARRSDASRSVNPPSANPATVIRHAL